MNEDLHSDPDWRKFIHLNEQMGLWLERMNDESLSIEERSYAETKHDAINHSIIGVIETLNEKWNDEFGPLPETLDEEVYQEVRIKLAANFGVELTIEELKKLLQEEKDND